MSPGAFSVYHGEALVLTNHAHLSQVHQYQSWERYWHSPRLDYVWKDGNILGKGNDVRPGYKDYCPKYSFARSVSYSAPNRICSNRSWFVEYSSSECAAVQEMMDWPKSEKRPGHTRVDEELIHAHMGFFATNTWDELNRLLWSEGVHLGVPVRGRIGKSKFWETQKLRKDRQ